MFQRQRPHRCPACEHCRAERDPAHMPASDRADLELDPSVSYGGRQPSTSTAELMDAILASRTRPEHAYWATLESWAPGAAHAGAVGIVRNGDVHGRATALSGYLTKAPGLSALAAGRADSASLGVFLLAEEATSRWRHPRMSRISKPNAAVCTISSLTSATFDRAPFPPSCAVAAKRPAGAPIPPTQVMAPSTY